MPEMGEGEFVESDLFAALQLMRRVADSKGIKICCSGSRADAWPSAMSRDMSAGRKIYVCKMGESGRREDLADLFSPCEPDQVATVEDQEAFHSMWFKSLGG